MQESGGGGSITMQQAAAAGPTLADRFAGKTRRAIMRSAPALGGAVLAACGAGGGTTGEGNTAPSKVTGTVRFATWASGPQAEMKQQQLDAFNQSQTGVKASLETS